MIQQLSYTQQQSNHWITGEGSFLLCPILGLVLSQPHQQSSHIMGERPTHFCFYLLLSSQTSCNKGSMDSVFLPLSGSLQTNILPFPKVILRVAKSFILQVNGVSKIITKHLPAYSFPVTYFWGCLEGILSQESLYFYVLTGHNTSHHCCSWWLVSYDVGRNTDVFTEGSLKNSHFDAVVVCCKCQLH